jgi:hypothetical protein
MQRSALSRPSRRLFSWVPMRCLTWAGLPLTGGCGFCPAAKRKGGEAGICTLPRCHTEDASRAMKLHFEHLPTGPVLQGRCLPPPGYYVSSEAHQSAQQELRQ